MTQTGSRPLLGISLKVVNVALITVLLALIKSIEGLPIWELMFFRMFFAGIILAAYLAARGVLRETLRTKRPLSHFIRSLIGLPTMGLTFVAVQNLPLPEAVTLQYTQPLFVVAFSALFLGAQVGWFRWGAVGIGFLGVLVITVPKLTLLQSGMSALSQGEVIGAASALGAAAGLATAILWTGNLVKTEKSTTIALWMTINASLLMLLTLPLGWKMLTLEQGLLMLAAGALGAVLQMAMNESLRYAPATVSAPFEYSSVIFAAILGVVVFGEIPGVNTLAGGALLVAAGLAIIWRERRIKRGRTAAAEVEMPQG